MTIEAANRGTPFGTFSNINSKNVITNKIFTLVFGYNIYFINLKSGRMFYIILLHFIINNNLKAV